LGRALGKPHLRLVGVDDGQFQRGDRRAPLVAVVISTPLDVEAVAVGDVEVDGRDATDRIVDLVGSVPQFDGARAVLLDGIAYGGFNLVDLSALSRRLDRPVIALTRRTPDFARIESALRRYFRSDFRRRWGLVRRHRLFRVATEGAPVWAAAAGCTATVARRVLQRATVHGYWPEPLRLAHLIGHAVGGRRGSEARANV
jgi:uncharacterized protein